MDMNADQLINQDTGQKEWYTPREIIQRVKLVLGEIDLDPASCFEANQLVGAAKFFTKEQDGLSRAWAGKVWMNHPFSREHNADWINKLCTEFVRGNVTEACCISFASTSESWFRPLLYRPQCFLTTRTRYTSPGEVKRPAPPKGSVVTYLGSSLMTFVAAFGDIGIVKVAVPESRDTRPCVVGGAFTKKARKAGKEETV